MLLNVNNYNYSGTLRLTCLHYGNTNDSKD